MDRRTDRQADGIAVASTALAMRALRRAVKKLVKYKIKKNKSASLHNARETLPLLENYEHCRCKERRAV